MPVGGRHTQVDIYLCVRCTVLPSQILVLLLRQRVPPAVLRELSRLRHLQEYRFDASNTGR